MVTLACLRCSKNLPGGKLCQSDFKARPAAALCLRPDRFSGPADRNDHRTKEVVLEPAQLDSPGQGVELQTMK